MMTELDSLLGEVWFILVDGELTSSVMLDPSVLLNHSLKYLRLGTGIVDVELTFDPSLNSSECSSTLKQKFNLILSLKNWVLAGNLI